MTTETDNCVQQQSDDKGVLTVWLDTPGRSVNVFDAQNLLGLFLQRDREKIIGTWVDAADVLPELNPTAERRATLLEDFRSKNACSRASTVTSHLAGKS